MKYDLGSKTNRFAQRALKGFSDGLMELLEEKRLEQVTASELCERCNYPRATFYNYFCDVYDLLDYCWLCMEQDMEAVESGTGDSESGILATFGLIYDYLETWRERFDMIMRHNHIADSSHGLFERRSADGV